MRGLCNDSSCLMLWRIATGCKHPPMAQTWETRHKGTDAQRDRTEGGDGQTADRAEGGDSSAAVALSPPFGIGKFFVDKSCKR